MDDNAVSAAHTKPVVLPIWGLVSSILASGAVSGFGAVWTVTTTQKVQAQEIIAIARQVDENKKTSAGNKDEISKRDVILAERLTKIETRLDQIFKALEAQNGR